MYHVSLAQIIIYLYKYRDIHYACMYRYVPSIFS